MTSESIVRVLGVYKGSDGDATKALYAELEQLGPVGVIGANLFRACKNSERAKQYRGGKAGRGSYRGMAYDRKQWALDNLTTALNEHAAACELIWGWGTDPDQPYHNVVLYVTLPTGQVSFHTDRRGDGPAYDLGWDGARGQSADRICRWCARLLAAPTAVAA